jgi:hypothetical protein
VSTAARLDPARARNVLALMGVDVYAPRGAADARPLAVLGDRANPVVAAIVRALGVDPERVRWGSAKALNVLAFGATTGAPNANAVHLPEVESLRGGAAKRQAWRVLRGLARKLAET